MLDGRAFAFFATFQSRRGRLADRYRTGWRCRTTERHRRSGFHLPCRAASLFGRRQDIFWERPFDYANAWVWPLHAVFHHSEVMTPVTPDRPLALVISSVAVGTLVRVKRGRVICVVDPTITFARVAEVNVILFSASRVVANVRRAQIWVGFALCQSGPSSRPHRIRSQFVGACTSQSVFVARPSRFLDVRHALCRWRVGTRALRHPECQCSAGTRRR